MRLSIHHSTLYRYDEAAHRVVQALRLWPISSVGQVIHQWQVEIDGHRLQPTCRDGFGNSAATHTVDRAIDSVRVIVNGDVETRDLHGIVGDTGDLLPPAFYMSATELTATDEAIQALAKRAAASTEDKDSVARLHILSTAVRDAIDYRPDQTHSQTTAAQALSAGAGVCQDHAHVLIAAARVLGFPARYVSGYLCADIGNVPAASHAWAEVHVPDLGWVGFDAANRLCPDERYLRVAVGRDYRDAAPVRGVRRGGGAETMEVRVTVAPSLAQQQ